LNSISDITKACIFQDVWVFFLQISPKQTVLVFTNTFYNFYFFNIHQKKNDWNIPQDQVLFSQGK